MKETLLKYLMPLVIGVLITALYFKNCTPQAGKPTITVVRDTVWISHDTTIYSKPTIVSVRPPKHDTLPPQYLPDTNYARLRAQYEALRDDYLSQRVSIDSVNLSDTAGMIGVARVQDTTQLNRIIGRQWSYKIKYPSITNTITIREPYKPRTQLYIGGDVRGNQTNPFSAVDASILLKNKADNMVGISVGITTQASVEYALHYYHKISFRRTQ